jgi:hypothetical protein
MLEEREIGLEETMRNRLVERESEGDEIKTLLSPDEGKQKGREAGPAGLPTVPPPTYAKVHRTHLGVETLHYYDIPYEYDTSNPEYIIVLREMSQRETDILFEHTQRLRTSHGSKLFIEAEGRDNRGKKEYAFVRKKSGTRSRNVGDSGRTGKSEVNDSASRLNVSLGDIFFE